MRRGGAKIDGGDPSAGLGQSPAGTGAAAAGVEDQSARQGQPFGQQPDCKAPALECPAIIVIP